jgi:hypothetical protein
VNLRIEGLRLSAENASALKQFNGSCLRALTFDILKNELNFSLEPALAVTSFIEAEKKKEELQEEQAARTLKKKEEQEERALKKKEEEASKCMYVHVCECISEEIE